MPMAATQLACTLYTLREYTRTPATIARTLARVKEIGYTAVQLSGLGPIEATELAKILNGEGLACCATHVSIEQLRTDIQKVVDAWYLTLDKLKSDPSGSNAVMAEKAGLSVADYEDQAKGTTLFDITKALNAFEDRAGDPTSLPEMARRINPFLVSSGIGKSEASLDGLFEPRFTKATADKRGSK